VTFDNRSVTTVTDYMPDPLAEPTHGDVLLSLALSCGVVGRDADIVRAEFADRFERVRTKQECIDVLLSAVGQCVDARHPFAYLSVPLTTGRAYIELQARQASTGVEDADRARAERKRTIADNRKRAYEAAERLRTRLAGMVIDPSRFVDVAGWDQPDYHMFWTNVIERYAEEVFFLDGWQYSVGCTIEFSTAVKLGLPTMTADLTPLDASTGWELVHAAVSEYAKIGLDPKPLSNALSITEADITKSVPRLNGD
jgi:hypothetical protein